jgi:hypothetical protein
MNPKLRTNGPGSWLETASKTDAIIIRGASGLGNYGLYLSYMIIAFGIAVLSLGYGLLNHSVEGVLVSIVLFAVCGYFFSGYQKFEFEFRLPEKCIYWIRTRCFRKDTGHIEFTNLRGIQIKTFSNPGDSLSLFGDPMATTPSGYPIPTAGIYLLLRDSSMAIVLEGMAVDQARRHIEWLKPQLPMFVFSEAAHEVKPQ